MRTLYHASPHKNLHVIKPQHTLSRDVYIGDYVFATANKKLAVMYLATKGLYTIMEAGKKPYIIIRSSPKSYMAHDMGGAIYELQSEGFTQTPQAGLEQYELVSKQVVKPLRKTIYGKSLDAMLAAGITIYFVTHKTLDQLLSCDEVAKMLPDLVPYDQQNSVE